MFSKASNYVNIPLQVLKLPLRRQLRTKGHKMITYMNNFHVNYQSLQQQ